MSSSMTAEAAMRHALTLASRGPATGVNPRVGCVILSPTGDMIAEGWHRGAGTAHAEVDALSKLAPDAARGATAVVTLEPCNHNGRTGPCSEALIAAGIRRVVYSITDPGETARGGADRLREAGIDVQSGVLADDAERFLHVWLTSVRLGRPFITLKWASSLDGRAAADDGSSQWITGTASRQHVHEQRAAADAIIVGTGTVIADDPTLTARGDAGELLPHQPVPVVIGERAIPADSKVLRHPHSAIVTTSRDVPRILRDLFGRGIRHAFVEGGPTLASAFVRENLVDEYLIYLAPSLIGGRQTALGDLGVTTLGEAKHLRFSAVESLGDDILIVASPVGESTRTSESNPTRSNAPAEASTSDADRTIERNS